MIRMTVLIPILVGEMLASDSQANTLTCWWSYKDQMKNTKEIKSTMESIEKNTPEQVVGNHWPPLGPNAPQDIIGCNKLALQYKKLLAGPDVMRDCYPNDPSVATEAETAVKGVTDFKKLWCPSPLDGVIEQLK
jgi:hypothetical protein